MNFGDPRFGAPSRVPLKIGGNLTRRDLFATYTDEDYEVVLARLTDHFGLRLSTSHELPGSVKAVIRGQEFRSCSELSPPTRIFMLLHTLGHYYFICRAAQMGISRYDYIYETSTDGKAHVYNYRSNAIGQLVTDTILTDRIEFEVRANDFAVEIVRCLHLTKYIPLIRLYEPADIRYIIDVMEGGPDRIVTDDEYIDHYVLPGGGVPQGANTELIFAPETFEHGMIDWGCIRSREIEIHYL